MPRKIVQIPKTKTEREAEKQRVRTLYCAGHSITDAARMVGVKQQTAFKWQQRDGWKQEVKEAQALVQRSSKSVHLDRNIAFDLAATNKETRSLLARGMHKAAKHIAEGMLPEEMINAGPQVKAIVSSAKEIDGTWEDSSANKFAVSLQLNTMISSGLIQDAPEGVEIVEEE